MMRQQLSLVGANTVIIVYFLCFSYACFAISQPRFITIFVIFPALLQGYSGVLRPQETSVACAVESGGFTRLDFAGSSSFSLIPFQAEFVSITSFQLSLTQVASNGAAVTVRVDFFTSTTVVSSPKNIHMALSSVKYLHLKHTE